MKLWILAAGVLAVTGAARGASWDIGIYPNALVNPGDFVTVSIYASFDESDYAFAGADFDLVTDDSWGKFYDVQEHLGGPGSFAGSPVGGDVLGIVTGQEHSPDQGVFADTKNPILVWTGKFTTSDFSYRLISFATVTSVFDVYSDAQGTRENRMDGLIEGLGGVLVCACPSPGTGAIGVVAAGLAWRRRR